MAGLDELFAQIPVADIANKIGADQGEVNNAIKTLVPALVGGLAQNVQSDDIDSSDLESAVAKQGTSDLLDGGVDVDQVDQKQGDNLVASLFGGNDSNAVASALAGTGAGGGDLIKKLLPILAPIVLAYIGKQLTKGGGSAPAEPQAQSAPAGGGGLGGHPRQHPRRCRRRRRCRRGRRWWEQPAGQHPGQRDRRQPGRRHRRHPRRSAQRQEVTPPEPAQPCGRDWRTAVHRMAR